MYRCVRLIRRRIVKTRGGDVITKWAPKWEEGAGTAKWSSQRIIVPRKKNKTQNHECNEKPRPLWAKNIRIVQKKTRAQLPSNFPFFLFCRVFFAFAFMFFLVFLVFGRFYIFVSRFYSRPLLFFGFCCGRASFFFFSCCCLRFLAPPHSPHFFCSFTFLGGTAPRNRFREDAPGSI